MSASVSYAFSPTTIIRSSEVNQNFTDLVNYFNNTACVANMVVGWKGSVASIPTGWTLDNDLKDKFIVGAGNDYAVGATGGEKEHTLSTAEMPVHSHGVTDPGHDHTATGSGGTDNSNGPYFRFDSNAGYTVDQLSTETTGLTVDNAGSGSAHENRPPYYAIAWIRKT